MLYFWPEFPTGQHQMCEYQCFRFYVTSWHVLAGITTKIEYNKLHVACIANWILNPTRGEQNTHLFLPKHRKSRSGDNPYTLFSISGGVGVVKSILHYLGTAQPQFLFSICQRQHVKLINCLRQVNKDKLENLQWFINTFDMDIRFEVSIKKANMMNDLYFFKRKKHSFILSYLKKDIFSWRGVGGKR